MAVVRQVQSKIVPQKPQKEVQKLAKKRDAGEIQQEVAAKSAVRAKKVCHFCTGKVNPAYWDVAGLRRFLNDRGRIVPRARSGACAKHQRRISQEIKRARHLALLPFTSRV